MSKSVDFYYDYGSPTAYLAFTQIEAICARQGATLNYKPMVLGAVFKATGNSSPVTIPAKAKFMLADLARWARHWGVPLQFNPNFPINTVDLMKAACGVQMRQPERFADFNRAMFQALWVDALNLNLPAVRDEVLSKAGFDPVEIAALMADADVKAASRANTDEAIARGAFGAPTFIVGKQLFWGQDRLFMVEASLAAAPV